MRILITGGAGFIGSNLARFFLEKNQQVVVFDNFSTGKLENLQDILANIELIEGDVRDIESVRNAMSNIDAVSHQAALGSVPRSIEDPQTTHAVNVNGTLNILQAMRKNHVKRIVFAASSSAYGHHKESPKTESMPSMPASPYAAGKVACENYLQAYSTVYEIEAVCLRYFNVFGPRQDPEGAYAAVIPRFVTALLKKEPPTVYGDGEQSRDFCHIDNVCRANWLALQASGSKCKGQPINIACGKATNLNQILQSLQNLLKTNLIPVYTDERPGDVKHSLADLTQARQVLGYEPEVSFEEGLNRAIDWYQNNL